MKTTLEFTDNQADTNEGLGDAGIETFKDTPYASAAKEAGQNSRDAMTSSPIKLTFKMFEIDQADLPCHSALSETIDACLRRVDKHHDPKEEDFFIKARDVLDKEKIKILEISDYNTTGLEGPSVDGKSFYAMLKGTGKSDKGDHSETSAGSFGIGKNASFAISELQTVFYSTIYVDAQTGDRRFLAQGKTKLVSHLDAENKPKMATGWWGMSGFKEINDPAVVPEWMRRKEVGTSVFALGFREEEEWEYRVVAALIRTFFIAIINGDMEFEIGNQITVDNTNIGTYFYDHAVVAAAAASDASEEFEFARALFECATAAEAIERVIDVGKVGDTKIGKVNVRILKRQNMPKRLGFVRNGMMITDNLKHFNHPFRSFPMSADFVALIQPIDDSGSGLLKELENPPHDQFSAGRINDDTKRAEARKIMDRFGKMIRVLIREETLSKPAEVEALNELAEFFADQGDDKEEGDGEPVPTKFKYTLKPQVTKKNPQRGRGKGSTGGTGTSESARTGKQGGSPGNGQGSGAGAFGEEIPFSISEERNIEVDSQTRKVYLTADETGKAIIEARAAGLFGSEKVTISSANIGDIRNGCLSVDLEKGVRFVAQINFSESYKGPLEIVAYRSGEAL